jgi:large subunit ribosomal protein L23
MADKTLIKKPLITEKASNLGAFNQYVFLVADGATGPEVKKAIEAIYKVKVTTVRTINIPSKKIRLGRTPGIKPGYRKAIVTLKKGEKLDILTA